MSASAGNVRCCVPGSGPEMLSLLLSVTALPDVASSCSLVCGYAEPESDEPDSIPFVPAFGSRPSRCSLMKSAGLKTWILVNGAFPYPAAGLSFFMRKGIWGGYASFRSDFRFMKPAYHCTSDGFLPDGSVMWPGERKLRTALSFTAGPVAGINKWLSLYAGAGYGYSHCMWTDIDGAGICYRLFRCSSDASVGRTGHPGL